jgi:DNA-binding TFAR19-related protein (PDSD5 family)
MCKFFTWTLAVTIACVWAAPLRAADDEVKLVPEEGAVEIMLLRQASVRKELNLTNDEAEKIHKFSVQQWKKAREVSKLGETQRDAQFVEMTKENQRFLDETLEPGQRKRLDEIEFQVAGLLCVTRPDVAAKLKLSAEQKERAPKLQKLARDEMEALIHTTNDEKKQEELAELRQTSRKRLLELLTDEQEATWKQLTGKPFEGELHFDATNAGGNAAADK